MSSAEAASTDERRDEHPRLLEIEYRNPLQREVIIQMLGEKADDISTFTAWAHEYLHRVSDILDHPEQEGLRALAREGKYKEAAEIVVRFLKGE